MNRYCTNADCPLARTCHVGNPQGNGADTYDCGDWYVAGPDERCLSYEPLPPVAGGQGRDDASMGAAVWAIGICLVGLIALAGWLIIGRI